MPTMSRAPSPPQARPQRAPVSPTSRSEHRAEVQGLLSFTSLLGSAILVRPLALRLGGAGTLAWAVWASLMLASIGVYAAGAGLFAALGQRAQEPGVVPAAPHPAVRTLSLSLAGLVVGLVLGVADAPVSICLGVGCAVVALWVRYADGRRALRLGWISSTWGVLDGALLETPMPGAGPLVAVAGVGTVVVAAVLWALSRPRQTPQVHLLGVPVPPAWPNASHVLAACPRGGLLFGLPDKHTLALGPTGSGKTTSVVEPNALSWSAGSLVVASTKQDVLRASVGHRRQLGGELWLLDVLCVLDDAALPPGVRRLRWTPLRGCADWSVARARAAAMMGATRREGLTDATHWTTQGERMLAPVLHAAALGGRTMRQVVSWAATAASLKAPLAILNERDAAEAADQLSGVLSQDPRPRDSIIATVATALHPYAGRVLDEAAEATDGDWDPATFVQGPNTLYVIAPLDSEVDDPAPIVVGVLSELYGAIRAESDRCGGRLPLPALWILDEVANISPLPQLPKWISEAGGRGLSFILGVQDLSQLQERWGRRGADSMWSNLTAKLVLPGVSDPDTLRRFETLAGETWVEQVSRSSGSSFGGGGTLTSNRTISHSRQPRWPAASIYGLSAGWCLVFRPDYAEPALSWQARAHAVEPFASWVRVRAAAYTAREIESPRIDDDEQRRRP
jgi:type IV secretion system protein VirD4